MSKLLIFSQKEKYSVIKIVKINIINIANTLFTDPTCNFSVIRF